MKLPGKTSCPAKQFIIGGQKNIGAATFCTGKVECVKRAKPQCFQLLSAFYFGLFNQNIVMGMSRQQLDTMSPLWIGCLLNFKV